MSTPLHLLGMDAVLKGVGDGVNSLDRLSSSFARILGFGATSGLGLAMDIALFAALIASGVDPFRANLASAGCAVLFVFFVSVRRIFRFRGSFLLSRFVIYAAWQVAMVAAASAAVGHVSLTVPAVVAKMATIPFTFGANYFFMSVITRESRRT